MVRTHKNHLQDVLLLEFSVFGEGIISIRVEGTLGSGAQEGDIQVPKFGKVENCL